MKKIILVFSFLLAGYTSSAQTEFRKGYVITKEKDTLFGELDYRSDFIMSSQCKFRYENTQQIQKYYPGEITAFRFENGRYFVSKTVDKGNFFLEFLVEGELDVYRLSGEIKTSFFVSKTGKLIKLPYEEKNIYKEGKSYRVKSKTHIGVLNYALLDAPSLRNQIANLDKLSNKGLVRLAKNYHKMVCDSGEECIVYQAQSRKTNILIELTSGVLNYEPSEYSTTLKDITYNKTGVLIHVSIPSMGDKWNLKTGFVTSKLNFDNGVSETFNRIPLQLEYISPKKRFKPVFAYGANLTRGNTFPLLSAGAMVKLSKGFSLNFNADFEFIASEKIMFIPKEFLSSSVMGGIVYKIK